jgi:type IV pilus assembly protein PilC
MAEAAIRQVVFLWEGLDRSGRRVKGEMSSTSDATVKALLRRQGVNPLKVRKKTGSLFGGVRKRKVTPKDVAVFSRQLATMMSSGVPLVQAFEIVGRGHENKRMQDLILSVKSDVEAGGALADGLRKHPAHFNELYVKSGPWWTSSRPRSDRSRWRTSSTGCCSSSRSSGAS